MQASLSFQCLVTLWQLLDDWMVLLDSDNDSTKISPPAQRTEHSNDHSNTHPTPANTDTATAAESPVTAGTTEAEPSKQTVREGQMDPSATAAKSKLCKPSGEGSVTQIKAACPSDDTPAMPSATETEGGDQHVQSPTIPRICALIQAFYLCTQSFTEQK